MGKRRVVRGKVRPSGFKKTQFSVERPKGNGPIIFRRKGKKGHKKGVILLLTKKTVIAGKTLEDIDAETQLRYQARLDRNRGARGTQYGK